MKTIFMLRHGSAQEKKDELADKDRQLTKTGKAEIRYVARMAVKAAQYPDLILSSPASRAIESAGIFAGILEYPESMIELSPALYESKNYLDIIKLLEELSDKYNSVCLVGHNPLFEEITSFLFPEFTGGIDKGSLVSIICKTDTWSKIQTSERKILFIDNIQSHSDIPSQIQEYIKKELYEILTVYFHQKQDQIIKHMENAIIKSSRKLSKKFIEVTGKKTKKILKNKSWKKD